MKKIALVMLLGMSLVKPVEPVSLTIIVCAAVGSAACMWVECNVPQQVRECFREEDQRTPEEQEALIDKKSKNIVRG